MFKNTTSDFHINKVEIPNRVTNLRASKMLLTVLLVLTCAHVVFLQEYKIPDNINIDDILNNDRLLKNYVNCVLEKGRCTPEGDKLKSK